MVSRLVAASVLAAAVLAGLAGLGGENLPCVAVGVCDGDPVGSGRIAQPLAAWSSLGLGAAAIWLVGRGGTGDRLIGWALLLSCIGALWYHASLTVWSGRVDAAGVTAVATAFAIRETMTGEHLGIASATGAAAVAATAVWGGSLLFTLAAGAIAGGFVLGRARARNRRMLAIGIGLLAVGGIAWVAGPHALWHLLAAAGLTMLALHLGSGPIPHPPLRFRRG